MTNSQCDLTNPNYTFSYCPSNAAAILFAVLFSVTTAVHLFQAVHYRKPFAGILIMGGIWEFTGYAIRSASINHPYSLGLNAAQLLLILLAPLWINAFIYMLLGRMTHFFLDDDRIFGVKARKTALLFVVFDIVAFLIQATGGAMSTSTNLQTTKTGLNVYTGGVALQLSFNVIFLALVVRFHVKARAALHSQPPTQSSPPTQTWPTARWLLLLTYTTTSLLLTRNVYRLAEFASGVDNTILRHEWYAYVFDALLMFTALVVLNIFHPGRKLQGPRCDFSEEDRAIKLAKRERREAGRVVGLGSEVVGRSGEKGPAVSGSECA